MATEHDAALRPDVSEWLLVVLVIVLALLAYGLIFFATLTMIEEDDERMRAAIPGWDELRAGRPRP